jgi:hypothetical protein
MVDFLDTYLPLIMSAVIGVIVASVAYFARQNATTVGGTIRLETVQGNVTEIKDEMKSGFNEVKDLIERKEKESQDEFRRISQRLESLEREGYNLRWRLEQLERNGRNGGAKSPV